MQRAIKDLKDMNYLRYAAVFTLLKWLGAVYLVYLGIKLIRSAPSASLGS